MSRFYGKIGYSTGTVETKPGVWSTGEIIEKDVVGDIKGNGRILETSNVMNPNITLNVKISFIADTYASNNYQSIKYIKFRDNDVKWEVKSVININYPRLIISLGGVYNG